MFQLAMFVMSLCLMRGGAGGDQVGDQVASMSAPVVRGAERGGEAGAITVTVRLPRVISHIDCHPPQKARQARPPAN